MYRFYNMDKDRWGEPFSLCDKHHKKQITPKNCVLKEIAGKSWFECSPCLDEKNPNGWAGEVKDGC